MRFLLSSIVICILLPLASLATSSSQTYTVQTQIITGGENISSSTYQQVVVIGTISGALNSSTYLNNIGFLNTVRIANEEPCTFDSECEGGYCCSNSCSSTSCSNQSSGGSSGGGSTPDSGSSGGSSGGGSSGGGGGGGIVVGQTDRNVQEQAVANFTLTPELLRFHLVLGESNTSELLIENTGETSLNITLDTENIDEFFTLSSSRITNLVVDESKSVEVSAQGKRFGSHFGEIIATAKGVKKTADVIIDVESKALFDVRLDIPQTFKYVSAKERPKAQITLFNIGSTPVTATITYLIKDAKGRTYSEESEQFTIEDEFSYVHEFQTSELPLGKYLAVIEVRYDDSFAVSSEIFSIVDKDTFTLAAPIAGRNITFFISLLVLSGIAYIAISYFMPSKHIHKKKTLKK